MTSGERLRREEHTRPFVGTTHAAALIGMERRRKP